MSSSYSFKTKLSRKKKKYAAMLYEETGLQEAFKSKYIMVCNAGLVSGLDLEIVVNIFCQYCSLQNVIMIPGKSYCFVECINEDEAEKAMTQINGKIIFPEMNKAIYLLFSTSVPSFRENLDFQQLPSGLILTDEFISESEEQLLSNLVREDLLNSSQSLKHRLVKHYGYEFNYKTNNVNIFNSNCESIPEKYKFLIEKLRNHEKLKNWTPNQITINFYHPGQGIPFHVDTHSAFDDYILSLSVGSDIIMDFKNHSSRCSILLRRRSILIMTEESRYVWSHGITPRKFDVIQSSKGLTTQLRKERISFTFRRVRESNYCPCIYRENCNSQNNKESSDLSDSLSICDDLANKLEEIHVHKVYDEIANHFSDTRHKPWPNVEQFIRTFKPGSVFLDIGCGNGKYFRADTSIFQLGCDKNVKLSKTCSHKGFESLVCDSLHLPFRPESVDYCICIAVIHHFATEERRIRAIEQILRTLRPLGQALIYVWSKNQQQHNKSSSYLKSKKNNCSKNNLDESKYSIKFDNVKDKSISTNEIQLPIHINRTQFKYDDMLVPWKLKSNVTASKESGFTYLRYYHLFVEGELERLCRKIQNNRILQSYYDQGNWCIILEKL